MKMSGDFRKSSHKPYEFEPETSKLTREIAFLREKGIPADLLAHEFGVEEGYIAVLAHRGRSTQCSPLPSADRRDSSWFRIPDAAPAGNLESVEALEQQVEAIFTQCSQAYLFMDGVAKLKKALQDIGNIADPLRRRVFARIYHYIAWFYLHSGYDSSAYKCATLSMRLSAETYETDLKIAKHSAAGRVREAQEFLRGNIDLLRYSETARIKSLAARKLGHPWTAWKILDSAHAAADRAGEKHLGSEYFRQRGALVLKNDIGLARKYFKRAADAMQRKNENKSKAHLKMVETRNLNVLDHKCEDALNLTVDIKRTFGTGSLEHVINAHYAAACCFSVDSDDLMDDGLRAVRSVQRYAKHFGNQATISKLLEMTPSFKLSYPDRESWIMHVLETNAFSRK
jgi:hypothetical protein